MSLRDDEIVWVFEGGESQVAALSAMVSQLQNVLRGLLPDTGGDVFDQLITDLTHDPSDALSKDPWLRRLFPPASRNPVEVAEFRRNAVHSQARGRIGALDVVLSDLASMQHDMVAVPEGHVDAWLQALSSLRAIWHVRLVDGDAWPDREATDEQVEANPELALLLDWLAYLIEDLLATRDVAHDVGRGFRLGDQA
ncbi:MAG TPA: DUF2017 family protein [Arachnia sp.]|nr:DUF2017 family protein [Arachnia sp.]HMT86069.1 DUF2017 family protein [Arachnia sp.]